MLTCWGCQGKCQGSQKVILLTLAKLMLGSCGGKLRSFNTTSAFSAIKNRPILYRLLATFPWWLIKPMQNIQNIDWFLPEILLIKESCNLIGQETQLATPNQKGSLRCYLLLMIISMQKINKIYKKN